MEPPGDVPGGSTTLTVPLQGSSGSMLRPVHGARSAMHMSLPPLAFLQVDQDINKRPKNWLVHDDRLLGRKAVRAPVRHGFSSDMQDGAEKLSLASLVGAVDLSEKIDFVGSAEDMKQLFMLPYSDSGVSLAIHNIGGSLFIDCDPSLGSQVAASTAQTKSSNSVRTDFRKKSDNFVPLKKKKSEKSTRNKRLYSKFLYHSMTDVAQTSTLQLSPCSDEATEVSDVPGVWIHNAVTGEIMFKANAPSSNKIEKGGENLLSPSRTSVSAKKLLESGRTPINRRIQDKPHSNEDSHSKNDFKASTPSFVTPAVHEVGTRMIYVYNPETKETSLAPVRNVPARKRQSNIDFDSTSNNLAKKQPIAESSKTALIPEPVEPVSSASSISLSSKPAQPLHPASVSHPTNTFMPGSAQGQFRTVHRWNFGSQSMLLGSNLILFQRQPMQGGDVVALALHDVEEPFSRKVVLGHWLDCTFANCPALALCFHRNGRVLGYHLVRTKDIPQLRLRDLPMNVGQKLEAAALALAEANDRKRASDEAPQEDATATHAYTSKVESDSHTSDDSTSYNNSIARVTSPIRKKYMQSEMRVSEASGVIQTNDAVKSSSLNRQNVGAKRKIPEPCFDPEEVCARAAELLRTLQDQCSRDSGTYCLFKPKKKTSDTMTAASDSNAKSFSRDSRRHRRSEDRNNDIQGFSESETYDENSSSELLQLFDLSSQMVDPAQKRKWKYLLAMVCFRFAARSARLDGSSMNRAEILRQRELLMRCLRLLKEVHSLGGSKHSSIQAEARLQLSDTYVREQALYEMGKDAEIQGVNLDQLRAKSSKCAQHTSSRQKNNDSDQQNRKSMSKSMRRRMRRNKAKQIRESKASIPADSNTLSLNEHTDASRILSMSKCVSWSVRQWSSACHQLTEGMREIRPMWNGHNGNAEDHNDIVFDQLLNLAQRLVQCTAGLAQSVCEMLSKPCPGRCACSDNIQSRRATAKKQSQHLRDPPCFVDLLLFALETTLIQCQGIIQWKRQRSSMKGETIRGSTSTLTMSMLSAIADAALSICNIGNLDCSFLPNSLQAFTSSFSPAPGLPQYGGDATEALSIPQSRTQDYWIRIAIFALTAGVGIFEATASNSLGPTLRKLAIAKNIFGQKCLAESNFEKALDAFSASLNIFNACNDVINVALVSLNVVATFRTMASGDKQLTALILSEVAPLEADQATLYENALSLCSQTISDLEKRTLQVNDEEGTKLGLHRQLKAVKRTALLSKAQILIDFGMRLCESLKMSLRMAASYTLENHLQASNSILEHFRNAISIADKARSADTTKEMSSETESDAEFEQIRVVALVLAGRFHSYQAGFFGKPAKPVHLKAASRSNWRKRSKLNHELSKRYFEKAIATTSIQVTKDSLQDEWDNLSVEYRAHAL